MDTILIIILLLILFGGFGGGYYGYSTTVWARDWHIRRSLDSSPW